MRQELIKKEILYLKRKSYNNVKTTSTADEIFQAAQAIASLCQLPLYKIERDDKSEINE